LSKGEVDALVAPHQDTVDLVEDWLAYHDVDSSYNDAGDWISTTVTVDKVEQMLGTKYNIYRHTVTSETIVRTMSYNLPSAIHDHVNVVTPATYFGTTKSMKATSFVSLPS
jgi:tripeptidyl-peptidase-1